MRLKTEALIERLDHDPRFELLALAAHYLETGDHQQASRILRDFPALDVQTSALDLQYSIFLTALSKRLATGGFQQPNLYLLDLDVRQIDLFDLMARKMPLVSMPGRHANRLIQHFLRDSANPAVVDIGTGSGQQMVHLLQEIASDESLRSRPLLIVGIEPAPKSLLEAEEAVLRTASELGLNVRFEGIGKCIEQFSSEDWDLLATLAQGAIFNEAFALHHVSGRAGRHDRKDEVIAKLASLSPRAFVLTEPHSNHESFSLSERFQNSWNHYGLAFRVIDRLDIRPEEKNAIKLHFFAREVEDVLGTGEEIRTERHETAAMWLDRLEKAGMKPVQLHDAFEVEKNPLIDVRWHNGYASFDFEGETVVSSLCVST